MKITIYLTISFLTITKLFSLAEAVTFSWTNEESVTVEQYLNELQLWMSNNKLEISKSLHRYLVEGLDDSLFFAADLAEALRLGNVKDACAEIKSLQQDLNSIFDVLRLIKDENLAAQWSAIYSRFQKNMQVARKQKVKPSYQCGRN
ncbi:uncharacterized protein LOC142224094 [Haematobia irritans]|uniref:uncharacterized protein LOC142224094 n=1 Tax=Haematobia irritans TaxID=7368 RepID=UPI003F4FAF1A